MQRQIFFKGTLKAGMNLVPERNIYMFHVPCSNHMHNIY